VGRRRGLADLSARRIALLVNPTAGRGRAARWAGPVADRFRAAGYDVQPLTGASAEESSALARKAVAGGVDALVALGGDGLVHLAVQAVAQQPVTLGIVPAGTGNDIARALGLPRADPVAATDVVLEGGTTAVDAARLRFDTGGGSDRWFAGVLASGFDSRVNERANAMGGGRARYPAAMLAELRTLGAVQYRITVDGELLTTDAVMVAVANTATYGAGMRIAPDADPTDGELDVTVVGVVTRRELLRVFPRVYSGSFVTHRAVRRLRGHTVRVEAADRDVVIVAYADGERVGPLPVTATVVPGALRVATPAAP